MESSEVSDAELIIRVRSGDLDALGALYARHRDAALRVARATSGDAHTAEDLVSTAFERIHGALVRGAGPDDSFRAYLYTVIRRLAIEHGEQGARYQDTDDFSPYEAATALADGTERSIEAQLVVKAMSSLPERHQAVLWYLDVEGMTPQQAAPLFGLTPNATSALAVRARDALRDAYLQAHVSDSPVRAECGPTRKLMGAYQRGSLSARDTLKVETHLAQCDECPIVLAELRDVSGGLRAILGPIIVGGAAAVGLGALGAVGGAAGTAQAAAGVGGAGAAGGASGSSGVGGGIPKGPQAAAAAVIAALVILGGATVVSAIARAPGPEAAPAPSAAPVEAPPAPASPTPQPTPTPTPEPPPPPAPEPPAPEPPAPVPEPTVGSLPPIAALSLDLVDEVELEDGTWLGSIDVTVRNGNDYDIDASLVLQIPEGITVGPDAEIGHAWRCDDLMAETIECVARAVEPGAEVGLSIPVEFGADAVGARPIANLTIDRS